MAVSTYRDTLRAISPRWLQRGNAQRLLFALGVHVDAFADALVAGLKQRLPGLYSPDALPLLGRERRIRRGLWETDAVYASRLLRWLDDHRRRGGPYALLAQLRATFAPSNFPIELLYYPTALLGGEARRYSMDADGVVERDSVPWIPDDDATHWARWWLIYHWPSPILGDGTWDDPGLWDPALSEGGGGQPLGVWDSDLTLDEVVALRTVPAEWNAAHAFGYLVLLPATVELWDYPLGNWDDADGIWGDLTGAGAALISVDG